MLKTIALILIVVIIGVLLFAATRPDSFRVERSIRIDTTPEKISALVEDFHAWQQWSPWENIDPNLKRNYSGAARGVGAAYAWEGNNEVGSGRMEILSATLTKIIIQLDFIKPFAAQNTAEFTFKQEGASTEVIWAMYGPSPYVSKLMGLIFSMDKMVGSSFETGLKNLKTAAERSK
ncbi:MAG TPA: SRPBCC family protein [Spongiibacteraceae bacterium]|nr:SRPBCC family protein [Spongiibacteraceae bacterium]